MIAKPTTREQALSNAITAAEEAHRLMDRVEEQLTPQGRRTLRTATEKGDVSRWTQVAEAWSRIACQLPSAPEPDPDDLIRREVTVVTKSELRIPAVPEDEEDEDWEYWPVAEPMAIKPGQVVTLQTLDAMRLVLRYLMDQYLPAGGIRVPKAWLDRRGAPPEFIITAGEKGIDCKRV